MVVLLLIHLKIFITCLNLGVLYLNVIPTYSKLFLIGNDFCFLVDFSLASFLACPVWVLPL